MPRLQPVLGVRTLHRGPRPRAVDAGAAGAGRPVAALRGGRAALAAAGRAAAAYAPVLRRGLDSAGRAARARQRPRRQPGAGGADARRPARPDGAPDPELALGVVR